MNDWTGTDSCGAIVDGRLSDDCRFWIVKRVIDGVEEEGATEILICFSERVLRTVRGEEWAEV